MTRRSRFLAAILGGTSAYAASHTHAQCLTEAVWVGTGLTGHWVDNTTSPKIRVTTGNSKDEAEVFLCESVGGFWTIIVQYTQEPGSAAVTIDGLGSARDIASVGVSAFNNMPSQDATLRFNSNIGHVHGVAFGGNIHAFDVHGVVLGDLGSVLATSIGAKTAIIPLEVLGDVFGDILLLSSGVNQGIAQMIVRGDILGDITVEFGKIDRLEVDGTIGLVGEGGAVTPVTIKTYGDIDELIAGQIIADITAGAAMPNSNPTPADIYLLQSTNEFGNTGHFIGSINARKIVEQLDIRGDLGGGVGKEAVVTLLQPVGASDTIRVGGSFKEGSEIVLAQNGLQGAILFNADQTGGVWESGAVVRVGGQNLTSNTHSVNPGGTGGGVASVSPSGLFGSACKPANNATVYVFPGHPASIGLDCDTNPPPGTGVGRSDVVLQIRTPFEFGVSAADAFVIRRRPVGSSGSWSANLSGDYSYAIDSLSSAKLTIFKPNNPNSFAAGYEYEIILQSGGLKAKHTAGSPNIPTFTYRFAIDYDCEIGLLGLFDMNNDGNLCSGDLAAWMDEPKDLTLDGQVCAQDAAALLSAINLYQNLD